MCKEAGGREPGERERERERERDRIRDCVKFTLHAHPYILFPKCGT